MATEKKTEEMVDIETADLDTVAEEVTTTDTIEEPETNVAKDTVEEPAEEITEESVETPAEETADEPAEKAEEEPVAETAETAEEEPAAETTEEETAEEVPEAEPVVDESTTVPPTNVDVPDMIQRNNVPVYQTPASAAPFTYVSGTFKVLGPVINGRVRVAFNIGGIGRTNGFAETKYFNF